MFALTILPDDTRDLAQIVTDTTAPRSLQRLAWAALKSARGQPVRQAQLAALVAGLPTLPADLDRRREEMRQRMLASLDRPTGGDAA